MLNTLLLGSLVTIIVILVSATLVSFTLVGLKSMCVGLIHTYFTEREEHYKRLVATDPESAKFIN